MEAKIQLSNLRIKYKNTYWEKNGYALKSKCTLPPDFFFDLLGHESSVLEIGCGTGRVLEYLAKSHRIERLHGIDWSATSINIAQNHIASANCIIGDCRSLPYPEKMFDGCVLSAVLTCFVSSKELHCVVKEACRILNSNGILFVSDFLITPTIKNIFRYIWGAVQYKQVGAFWSGYPFRHFSNVFLKQLFQNCGTTS